MSELMEHCLHLIKSEKTWLSVNRLREVTYIHNHRANACKTVLFNEVGHPCATSLGRTWEIVGKEDTDERSISICNLESLNLRMIYRNAFKLLEIETEELMSCVEHTLTHVLHLEVWLCSLLVKSVLLLAYLLCIISPVPRFDL